MNITDILTGGVAGLVKDIIDKFKLSPEAKLEFDKQIEANKHEIRKIEADLEAKLVDSASANIRAETQSSDKYTSRARPTFAYVIMTIFICNFIVFPLINKPSINLPDALFWLFGSWMLGYTGARTWEKFNKVA